MIKAIISFAKSFKYAYSGICYAIKNERNFRFHLCAAFYLLCFSAFYSFSSTQFILLVVLIVGVLSLELVNTAIENAVSSPDEKHFYLAGIAKDTAAAAVLVFSIGAAVCGFILFYKISIISKIIVFFTQNIIMLIVLIISLVFSVFFIFKGVNF